jgi:SAM-dependent methyltransferase
VIETLDRVIAEAPDKPVAEGAAAFQENARRVVTDPAMWTPEAAAFVEQVFDGMAATWEIEHSTNRFDALTDALARGGPMPSGACLEVGSGTGQQTPLLADAFTHVVSIDLSWQMLLRAPAAPGVRVRADAARLPLGDGSMAAVTCVDALLFPAEVTRVLRDDGVLLWISQLGADGPLFVDTPTVLAALTATGGRWTAVQAAAGWGTWAVIRRAG